MKTSENIAPSGGVPSADGLKPNSGEPKTGILGVPEIVYQGGEQYPPNLFIVDQDGRKHYLEHTVWDKYY